MSGSTPLPGSVAEVASSPEGPEVGAFFDFDGTVMAGYSAVHVSRDRIRHRDVSLGELVGTVGFAVNAGLGHARFEDMLNIGAAAWKGRSDDDLVEMAERVFRQTIADLIYPEVRELVSAHLERGHTVVLSSSATEYQVEPVARYLGIDRVLCNRYSKHDGVLTGKLEQPIIWGASKATVVREAAEELGIDLTHSYAYADGDEDVDLMELVGHPRPTNPGKRLARVAESRGWPVLRFSSRSSRRLGTRVRELAGAAVLGPLVAGGAAVGLLRRDRRAGVNFSASRWLAALLAINRVKLEVVGRENLDAPRPALFVYNHRTNVDPFLAASLVGRDFASVVDSDLRRDPVAGLLGTIADVAFVDWNDPDGADDATHHLETMAAKGLSLLVAAEGAPADTTTVGELQHGPFRVAAQAGLPTVPIVLRNAELLAGRTSSATVPGVVDVAVLAPIPTASLDAVDDHVTAVRQVFLDTLAHWPEPA